MNIYTTKTKTRLNLYMWSASVIVFFAAHSTFADGPIIMRRQDLQNYHVNPTLFSSPRSQPRVSAGPFDGTRVAITPTPTAVPTPPALRAIGFEVQPVPSLEATESYINISDGAGSASCDPTKPGYNAMLEVLALAKAVSAVRPTTVFVDFKCESWLTQHLAALPTFPGLRVVPISGPTIWTRDFGAFRLARKDDPAVRIFADLPYFPNSGFSYRPNSFVQVLATNKRLETIGTEQSVFDLQGGNFQVDHQGRCFMSDFGDAAKKLAYTKLAEWFGCTTTTFLEPLPEDGTRHVDMYFSLLNRNTVMMPIFAEAGTEHIQAVMNRNYAVVESMGFRIIKIPHSKPVEVLDNQGAAYPWKAYSSYANSYVAAGTIFLPQYDSPLDAQAVQILRDEGFQVVPLSAKHLAPLAGSLHCTINEI